MLVFNKRTIRNKTLLIHKGKEHLKYLGFIWIAIQIGNISRLAFTLNPDFGWLFCTSVKSKIEANFFFFRCLVKLKRKPMLFIKAIEQLIRRLHWFNPEFTNFLRPNRKDGKVMEFELKNIYFNFRNIDLLQMQTEVPFSLAQL